MDDGSVPKTPPERKPDKGADPFPVMSCADFMRGPDSPDFLIDGILERARPMLLAGPYKSLKTRTADDLALSLAAGVPALGFFPTRPARVLIVPGETPPEDKRRSLKAVAAARGVSLPIGNILFPDGWFPRLPESVPNVVAMLKRERPEALIIDPAYRAMGAVGQHAANMIVMGDALSELSEAATREGCAVVVVHHTNEQLQPGQRPDLRHVAFSGFAQWARSWVLLNRRSRYAEGSGRHSLVMVTGGAGRSECWHLHVDEGTPAAPLWSVKVAPADNSPGSPVPDAEDARKVVEFLTKHPGGETRTVIRDRVGLDTKRATAALEALTAAGRVKACQVMKGGNREGYPGFRLTRQQGPEGRDKVGNSDPSDLRVPGDGVEGSEGRRGGI